MSEAPLVCPRCGAAHPADERFCSACGMPLVQLRGTELERTERQERARKVKKQYAEGDLVQVAGALNQPEAELVQNLLLEEGVPSMLRRTRGFDVPEMLAAGPRDVLVPASGATVAREVLLKEGLHQDAVRAAAVAPRRLLAGVLLAVVLVALVVALGAALIPA